VLASLVIVSIIDINGMAIVEAERDAPISGNRHRPITSKASLERVQSETGDVHIVGSMAAVQYRKYVAKFFKVRRCDPFCRSPIVKSFEPAMLERPDHAQSCDVVCRLSSDKHASHRSNVWRHAGHSKTSAGGIGTPQQRRISSNCSPRHAK
jgi:hypothetical protein